MDIKDIVRTEPRLLSLWEIGPVHRAALEQFADRIAERAIAEALVSVSHAVAEERKEIIKAVKEGFFFSDKDFIEMVEERSN